MNTAHASTVVEAEVPKKLDEALDELVCPLCMDTFVQPLSLSCLHSYCENCLLSLAKANNFSEKVICPECRAVTGLLSGGVKDLPINFKLKRFVEILSPEERQKIVRRGSSRTLVMMNGDGVVQSNGGRGTDLALLCPAHKDKPLEYYCCPCQAVICGQCMIDDHRIHGEVRYASDIVESHASELRNLLPHLERVVKDGNSALGKMKKNLKKLEVASEREVASVRAYFASLQDILKEKEKEIVMEIGNKANKKDRQSQKHANRLLSALEEAEKCRQVVEDAVETRSPTGDLSLLQRESQIRSRVQAGVRLVEEHVLNVRSRQEELISVAPFVPDPSMEGHCRGLSYASPSSVQTRPVSSVVGDSNTIMPLPPSKSMTNAMATGHSSLLSPLSPASTTTTTPQRSCGTFSAPSRSASEFGGILASRSSTVSAGDAIAIKSPCGEDTTASPYQPLAEIEGKNLIGPHNSVAAYPHGVCCTSKGTILVTDCKHHLFRIITSTGKCLETIGTEGKGDGQFFEPTAIAGTSDGSILVVDGKGTGRVQKFSAAGMFQSKFKVRSLTTGCYMAEPVGVAVMDNGDVLVADSGKCCVHQFDGSGKYQGKFCQIMELKQPNGIAASKTRVVLSDLALHCIFVLTQHGQLLTKISQQGSLPGKLSAPYGVAIDNRGYIFVSESSNHRISIFNPGGKFERCFGQKGCVPGEFNCPKHICFNGQGQLVVCDEENQRLQVFHVD